MNWFDALMQLTSISAELKGIRLALERMNDRAEGKLPPPPSPPSAPDEPELMPGRTDAYFAQIEAIENRYLATSGRLPTDEELVRELDEGEIGEEETAAALLRRGRVPS